MRAALADATGHTFRIALVIYVILAIGMTGSASAADAAKDPPPPPSVAPSIGGAFGSDGHHVFVRSDGTVPVRVTFDTSDPNVSLRPSTFTLDPGGEGQATIVGPISGTVTAHLRAISDGSGDAVGTDFVVKLAPYTPPFDPSPFALLILGGIAMLLILARVRPWRYRIVAQQGQGLAEYALILALIAIVAIVALLFLGREISTLMSTVGDSI